MTSASRWSLIQMWAEATVFSKLMKISQTVNMVTEGSESTQGARAECSVTQEQRKNMVEMVRDWSHAHLVKNTGVVPGIA